MKIMGLAKPANPFFFWLDSPPVVLQIPQTNHGNIPHLSTAPTGSILNRGNDLENPEKGFV